MSVEPFGTRVSKALFYGWGQALRELRCSPTQLARLIGKSQSQLAEADSDPLWADLDNLLAVRIATLQALRLELANKVEAERMRRVERRAMTKR